MSRTERLLDLIDFLRSRRVPVPAHELATEMGVSIRTLYRDIATLQAQGADIRGEPGLGYVLREGFMLPPLMFTVDEIEAMLIGSRWLSRRSADERLARAAEQAIGKIGAVLPGKLRQALEDANFLVAPGPRNVTSPDFAAVRSAIRSERKLEITYRKDDGSERRRVIWPFAVGFFDSVQVVVAWCEWRQGFRHFRLDRIAAVGECAERYPRRRHALLHQWRQENDIPDPAGN